VEHEAIEELLGAYALNAVEPNEAFLIGAHVSRCSECRAEFEQHLEVAALLPASVSFAPTSVWDAISGEIVVPEEIAASSETAESPPAVIRPDNVINLRVRWLRPMAAAAAFVLIAGAAVVQSVRVGQINDELAAERAAVAALTDQLGQPVLDTAVSRALDSPLSRQVVLGSQVSGSNAIIVLMPDGIGYLAEHSLKPLPNDRTYQLWAIVDGKVISAGILGPEPGVVPFHIDPAGFEGFAITEEVVGGVPASQNEPVVAWLAA
jgi:hypothetical protein